MGENKIIIYSLATQHENLGDLLINQTLISWLKKDYAVVIENKGVPDWFLERAAGTGTLKASDNIAKYSIKSVKFYKAILFGNASVDAIVLSPGHFGDTSIRKNFKKAMLLLVAILLRMKGISIFRVGISFGSMNFTCKLIESLSAHVFRVYGVRDEESKNMLIPFGRKQCIVIPDLSFLAYERFRGFPDGERQKNTLLISFRGDRRYPKASKMYENMIYNDIPKEAATLFEYIICYSQVKFDKYEQLKLSKLLDAGDKHVSFKEEYSSLERAAHLLSEADVIITNRLHVLLPAMMLGRLALTIGSDSVDSKISAILQDMGLSHLFYDVEAQHESFSSFLNRSLKNKNANIEITRLAVNNQAVNTKKLMKAAFGT